MKKGRPKQYFANDNFFSSWSNNMAYCLGFIAADGHVWKNRPYFTIGIHKKDKAILEFIRNCISPTSKIRKGHNDQVQICVHSKQIWEDLNNLNINHNKTFNLKIDYDIPDEFWLDFLRGFFDGDGCVYEVKTKTEKNYHNSVIISASYDILNYFQSRLGFGKIRKIKNKYYQLWFNQSECIKLRDLLYNNIKSFALKRKMDIFFKIEKSNKFWSQEELDILKNIGYSLTYKEIQEKFLPNRTKQAILDKRRKYFELLNNKN